MTRRRTVRKTVRKVKNTAKKLNRRKPSIKKSKAYSKARRVVRKLNSKPNKKLVERVVKRTTKKIARKSVTLTKAKLKAILTRVQKDPIEVMTAPELRQYIKDSVKIVNAALPTMSRASKLAVKEARPIFGAGDIINTLSDKGLYKDKKARLVEKARMLEAIMNGDGVSSVALIKKNMKTIIAFNQFKKGAIGQNFEGITFEEYNEMMNVAGQIQDTLKTHGNSETYMEIERLWEYKDILGFETVGDIFKKTFEKNKSKGLNEKELKRLIEMELQERAAGR